MGEKNNKKNKYLQNVNKLWLIDNAKTTHLLLIYNNERLLFYNRQLMKPVVYIRNRREER